MLNSYVGWISLGINCLVLLVSIVGFLKIMKNDLSHIQADLIEIKEKMNNIDKKVDSHGERIATIEGKMN